MSHYPGKPSPFAFLRNRFFKMSVLILVAMSILGGRLAYVTLAEGKEYASIANYRKQTELSLKGVRGNIYDRNGVLLATSAQSYDLTLLRQNVPSQTDDLNQMIRRILVTGDLNGDTACFSEEYNPIVMTKREGGPGYVYAFTWADQTEAQQKNAYARWMEDVGIDKEDVGAMTAEQLYAYLMDLFKVGWIETPSMAHRIMSVRLALHRLRFRQYESVTIAENVNDGTAAQLESIGDELPGLSVQIKDTREYPLGDVGCHLIGYVGRITDSIAASYEDNGTDLTSLGYDIDADLIGITGIEKYAETWLTANLKEKQGTMRAETSSTGRIFRVLSETPPENGDDVYLTIDSRLQAAYEDLLKQELAQMTAGEGWYTKTHQAPDATRGAIVMMDVHTGEVLAAASSSTYDLNTFIPYITNDAYAALLEDKTKPLTSTAFQERLAPGSVYKMFIGLAALEEGVITPHEQIYDTGIFNKYSANKSEGPRCWLRTGHGNETVVEAIKHSCDYFFYETADRLTISKINEWADKFGLNGTTGFEIGEVASWVGSPERKVSDEKWNIQYDVRAYLNQTSALSGKTDEQIADIVVALSDLSEESSMTELSAAMKELGLYADAGNAQNNKIGAAAEYLKYSILRPRKIWTRLNTALTGIGQSYVQMTPLNMARYICTLANDGDVLQARLMKGTSSTADGVTAYREIEPVIQNHVDIDPAYMALIHEGMWSVVNDRNTAGGGAGTGASYFKTLDPSITLAGKTGTAQIDNIEDHNTAWFAAYTPYPDADVALVVMIEKGKSSAIAAHVAQLALEEYYRIMQFEDADSVTPDNLLP